MRRRAHNQKGWSGWGIFMRRFMAVLRAEGILLWEVVKTSEHGCLLPRIVCASPMDVYDDQPILVTSVLRHGPRDRLLPPAWSFSSDALLAPCMSRPQQQTTPGSPLGTHRALPASFLMSRCAPLPRLWNVVRACVFFLPSSVVYNFILKQLVPFTIACS